MLTEWKKGSKNRERKALCGGAVRLDCCIRFIDTSPVYFVLYGFVLFKNNVARSKMTLPTTTAAQVVPLIKVQARRNVRLATKTHKHNLVIFR